MILTDEQQAIIRAEPALDAPVKVTAFAGTGKTSTLKEYASVRPQSRMLYVAYNKSIQLEAQRKMPHNVESRTVHSLAFRQVGHKYKDKLGNVRVGDIMRLLGISNYKVAYFVSETLKRYIASSSYHMTKEHVPKGIARIFKQDARYAKEEKPIEKILSLADDVWTAMREVNNTDIMMSHDGYLKLYQIGAPRVRANFILMDEAQDTTPCVWSIIMQQPARKVIVGDPHQAIYGWRGATDALSQVMTSPPLDLSLTLSFRFGEAPAKNASRLLARLKEENRTLRGNPDVKTEIHMQERSVYPDGSVVICRGNAEVFRLASEISKNRKIGFIGGSEGYRLQLILDVLALYEGHRDQAQNPLIRAFETFADFSTFAHETEDIELIFACETVEAHGPGVRNEVARIRGAEVDPRIAAVTFSTVHKAKGMEWDNVYLGNDLKVAIMMHWSNPVEFPYTDEEANILYVALTRGIRNLTFHPVIKEFIEVGRGHHRSEYSW